MRKKLTATCVLLFVMLISGCTDNPAYSPENTSAKANMDQAKALDSINVTLKRIADALEKR